MKIKLKNVRLSYPNLWKARSAQEGQEAKYSASLVMDKVKNADAIREIQEGIRAVGKEQWPKGMPTSVKTCLRDGSEKDNDGYGPTTMFVSASNATRVPVVDKDPSVALAHEDGRPYAGCYVNAVVRLWAQDNQYGKRVNCQLQGIQFWADGEAFGDKPADAMEMFGEERAKADDAIFTAPAASESAVAELKTRLRSHPEWNITLKAADVNTVIGKRFNGATVSNLTEAQARDVLADFEEIVSSAIDPF